MRVPNHVQKLYSFAYSAAKRHGVNSSESHLFLRELKTYNILAFSMCCADISDFIGG